MGACRTVDPAGEAGWQQAPCRGARSDERDHVYFEHRMPVACDPERPAATQHTVRLSRLVELRRHAGSHPSRALCEVAVDLRGIFGWWCDVALARVRSVFMSKRKHGRNRKGAGFIQTAFEGGQDAGYFAGAHLAVG